MDRKELAIKMREAILNQDKENINNVIKQLSKSIVTFYHQEINLDAKYKDISYSHQRDNGIAFTFKNATLLITLLEDENKITVKKLVRDGTKKEVHHPDGGKSVVIGNVDEEILDVIISKDGELKCNDGKFDLSEIDTYLSKCFSQLL